MSTQMEDRSSSNASRDSLLDSPGHRLATTCSLQSSKSDDGVTLKVQKCSSFKSEKDVTVTFDKEALKKSGGGSSEKSVNSDGNSSDGGVGRQDSRSSLHQSPVKVPKKFITNWKHACDRTKDRTRELLKKWRTLPEAEMLRAGVGTLDQNGQPRIPNPQEKGGWSVHVWSTWVNRYSEERGASLEGEEQSSCPLTEWQREKFGHFFNELLDTDRDGVICAGDIEHFIEKLRHFADWSFNSTECNILLEVQKGFLNTFITPTIDGHENESDQFTRFERETPSLPWTGRIELEEWLTRWHHLTAHAKTLMDFPVWIQYFCKVLFNAVNRSGSGAISREELSAFYFSVLGLETSKVTSVQDTAYRSMTSNGDYALCYPIYRLCFANFLLAKYPNGPGQWVLGQGAHALPTGLFPIDYSALNADPGELEHYTPDKKSYRRSVVV